MDNIILQLLCATTMLKSLEKCTQIPFRMFDGYDTHYYIISVVATIQI